MVLTASVNSKPHIAIDLRMYRMAGIGRYLQNLLSNLLPLLNASEISILGKSGDLAGEAWLRDPRIRFQEFRPRIFSVAEQWAAAAGRYRNFDLLWIPQYNLPLLYRGKLVVTIHDLCQLAHPETLGNDLQRCYAQYLLSRVARRASAILCTSEFTASEVQKYLQVDRRRLVVTYPPCGDTWGLPIAPPAKSSSAPYLLTVGNIKKHKNLPRLIAAYNGIRNLITHDLVIVGKREGFLNSETQLQAVSADCDGRIRFTGEISDQELKVYYGNATALIFPSFYEGFGFPLIEAMAAGCPIACSNVASLPEVAGNAALFFNPFNVQDMSQALLQIATDARLRDALTEQGRRRILRFVGNTSAELTATTINRLLET
jgi:glycosyltransferase involved in cell wall biosynthesis